MNDWIPSPLVEQVWIDVRTSGLHVTPMKPIDAGCWLSFDPQSYDRACDQAEPPMDKRMKATFHHLGEL